MGDRSQPTPSPYPTACWPRGVKPCQSTTQHMPKGGVLVEDLDGHILWIGQCGVIPALEAQFGAATKHLHSAVISV
jgi:hypothetical protein